MVIYILTKFGADWLIFVDARMLTRKLWIDRHRQTVSDHNSSLSTPCSGELKSNKPFTRQQNFSHLQIGSIFRSKSYQCGSNGELFL